MSNIKLFSSKGRNGINRRAHSRVQKSAQSASRPKTKSKNTSKKAIKILLISALGVIVLMLVLGFYVNSLDTVFPNVWMEGVKLSGLTIDDATQMLINMGYESNPEGLSVAYTATVVFPDGDYFSIAAEEAGFALDGEAAALTQEESARVAATKAFEYGRDGAFMVNGFAFIGSLFSDTELTAGNAAELENVFENELVIAEIDSYVRGVVSEHTRKFNEALVDDAYTVSSDSIVVVKGSRIAAANENEVFELARDTLFRAVSEQTDLTADYVPSASEGVDVDLDLL